MATLVIDNFKGTMTNYQNGSINSGKSYEPNVAGANPFVKPGRLTWNNAAVQIDAAASVLTDMVMAGKERVESGILYVYAIGHTGRIYKIQVNDPASHNPDYDNPVLLTTLTINSPTFTRGGSIDFFGSTEHIYIGHDMGVTRVDFTGANETFVGSMGSWTQLVPRPFKQFVGKLYIGNGSNIAEVDSTETVTTYTKLAPGFPTNTQVRDLDTSTDGNYIEIVVTRLALPDITSAAQDTTSTANSESYIFKWNGVDSGYTSFITYPSFSLNANIMFQNYEYTFGYDQFGMAVFAADQKIVSVGKSQCPSPNAIISTGNLLMWMTPLYYLGVMEIDIMAWGSVDFEIGPGFWDLFFQNATGTETDVIKVPYLMEVSNVGLGSSSNGYAHNIYGVSKVYFSTLETSGSPTTKYKFYKWSPIASPNVPSSNIIINALYQTQTEIFSEKVSIKAVRIYGEPWATGNSFSIDLIGSAGTAITGGSKTFTAGSNLTVGADYAWYSPQTAPTYALGVTINNLGSTNFVINKIEIDYIPGGK